MLLCYPLEYDGHLVLEKERLTEHNETILSLLHKGDVSYQLLISGITDYVEQLGYPTREYYLPV